MNFKKIVWLFVFFVAITKNISAQTDSTDLNFYVTEDSLIYNDSLLQTLHLKFPTNDMYDLGKICIEINITVLESNTITFYREEFAIEDFLTSNLVANEEANIDFGLVNLAFQYEATIRLIDVQGFNTKLITKILIP